MYSSSAGGLFGTLQVWSHRWGFGLKHRIYKPVEIALLASREKAEQCHQAGPACERGDVLLKAQGKSGQRRGRGQMSHLSRWGH